MSTLEKTLGIAVVAVALIGAVLSVLGTIEAGLLAALLVMLYGLYLVAQLLREARRQKRSMELLRESGQLSRQAITEARLEATQARNEIVESTRRNRAEFIDQSRRSNSRDANLHSVVADLGARLDAESVSLGASIAAHITNEARDTRAIAQELGASGASRLVHAEEQLAAQIDTQARHVRRKVAAEGATIIEGMTKNDAELKESVSSATEVVTAYQQVTTQKLIAQQDGLRHVVDLVRGAVADLGASAGATGTRLEDVEQGIELLTDNARVLSEHVLGMKQRVADVGLQIASQPAPSMVDVGERMDALRVHSGDSAEMLDIDVSVASHREALGRLRTTLQEVRQSERLSEDQRQKMLSTLYAQLGMQDVRQEFVLDINTYDVGVSFRAQMVRLMHLKGSLAAQGYEISPRENDKMRDREFAMRLGIPTPTLLFRDVPTREVVLEPNSIIKPVVGESSRGVFYVRPDLHLVSLKTRNVYPTFLEAAAEYERWLDASPDPHWIGERAILDENGKPARDIKVFMFYGKVGLFREILRPLDGDSATLTAAYDENGQRIAYRYNDDPEQHGTIPENVVAFATALSLASPVPFLRADFLVGADGPVLGEITPQPGGIYAGDAYDDVDRRLGQMFLEADARLTIDFLNRKDFGAYLAAYNVRSGTL